MKPFDFVESISYTKIDLIKDGANPKDYVPYLTNKALSYFPDSVLYANEMNVHHALPKDMQYAYLLGSVRRRRRRSGWHKADAEKVRLAGLAAKRWGLSPTKARQAIELMAPDQIKELEQSQEQGGY